MNNITVEMISAIEQALGFELYTWQRSYLLGEPYEKPEGRRTGATVVHIVKTLLTNEKPIDIKRHGARYRDGYYSSAYGNWFAHEMRYINNKLINGGLTTRTINY